MVLKEKVLISTASFFMFMLLLMSFGNKAFAAGEKVYDYGGLFSEEKKAEIQERATQLSEQSALDIIIMTINDTQGKTSMHYAKDYYEQNQFGYAETADGILYLLNLQDQEVYIHTDGIASDIVPLMRAKEIANEVEPFLEQENYDEVINIFLTEIENIQEVEAVAPMEYPDTENGRDTSDENLTPQRFYWYLIISIAAGVFVVYQLVKHNEGRPTVTVDTYLEKGSFKLTRKVDQYYFTDVKRKRKN